MIPAIGLLIWAYGTARIVEIVCRSEERRPSTPVIVIMLIMLAVMTFTCIDLQMTGADIQNQQP